MDGGYLGFGKVTSVGARGKSRLEKVFAGQNFQLAQIFGFECSDLFFAPRGNVCYFDAISAAVLKFCVVQLDGFDRMPIFFGGVSERSTRTMSSEKFRVFVCEAGRAQFDELFVFRDAGWS
jgi:hypothetical protein